MSSREWKRLDAIERVDRQELTIGEAAQILGIGERQFWNIRRKVSENGPQGVVNGLRGRSPANRIDELIRERIVTLARGKYAGFNDTHFAEKLPGEKIQVSRATVQRVLRQAGVEAVRRRRPSKHRRRRDRKPQEGLMVLWDGSRHAWLEDRGPFLCLMGAVDDATGKLLPGAHFVEQECAAGYLRVLLSITKEHGLPWSVYMDRHGSLQRNDDQWTLEEELRGEQDPTQVGRALKTLGIEAIYALSPQAKGRVERLWGTLQDRLVSELRLAKARTLAEANVVLARFVPEYNTRFAVAPKDATPAWRAARGIDLERVCSFAYDTVVKNDNTVRLAGVVIDIPPGPVRCGYAKVRVEVRQLLDGSWRVYDQRDDGLLASAAAANAGQELRAAKRRKRSAASRAFRRGLKDLALKPARSQKGHVYGSRGMPLPPFNWRRWPKKKRKGRWAVDMWTAGKKPPPAHMSTASTTTKP